MSTTHESDEAIELLRRLLARQGECNLALTQLLRDRRMIEHKLTSIPLGDDFEVKPRHRSAAQRLTSALARKEIETEEVRAAHIATGQAISDIRWSLMSAYGDQIFAQIALGDTSWDTLPAPRDIDPLLADEGLEVDRG